jgi:N-acetylmuramoyl-L-alanine amidase
MKLCKMKHFLLLGLLSCLSYGVDAQENESRFNKLTTVVIDPGHGGKDPGAIAKNLKEKDINLWVGLRLGELIEKAYPDVKVVYTRKDDRFVELHERGNIANRAKADLFISIHVNSNKSATPSGTEVYVMGAKGSNNNLEVMKKENSVITYEEDYTTKYEGFDPNSAESYIMFSLMQYGYQVQSIELATLVNDEFRKEKRIPNRGVKQAVFLVLWKTAMPSILAEYGFISNATDARILASTEGKEKYAQSLFKAFCKYKTTIDGSTPIVAEHVVKSQPVEKKPDLIQYAVQIASSPEKMSLDRGRLRKEKNRIVEKKSASGYKYLIGVTEDYNEAMKLRKTLSRTFKGAFVVGLKNGEIIKASEARTLKSKK